MNNIVCFSLYGNQAMYRDGIIENAKLLPIMYPGWKMRVYCEDNAFLPDLIEMGVELIRMGMNHGCSGMMWRMAAAWDKNIDHVIFRDADSRLNLKEVAAVNAWMQSGKVAHCMHDHPHHTHPKRPILAGMWGIKPKYIALPNMLHELMKYSSGISNREIFEPILLGERILPYIQHSLLRHSSVHVEWPYEPFPEHEPIDGFVGQQYDNNMRPIWPKVG